MTNAGTSSSLVAKIAALQDAKTYAELNWEGSFEDYLTIVRQSPRVTRTAFQRIYDMILSHGKTEYIDNKKRLIRYHVFHDEPNGGRDAVYGLDVPLMKLVLSWRAAMREIRFMSPEDSRSVGIFALPLAPGGALKRGRS